MELVQPGNSILVEKRWSLCGQLVVLVTEDSAIFDTPEKLSKWRSCWHRLSFNMKGSNKCESVAKTEDGQVANLWGSAHV
jgi:hypothetical protein